MASRFLMTAEEYLSTGFEPDCEYLDGVIVERNLGEWTHASIQGFWVHLLWSWARSHGMRVVPELRTKVSASRFRIPDIGVWRIQVPAPRVPDVPPFLAIEILSPDDRMVRIHAEVQEYLDFGVQWVWVIDPQERQAIGYSQTSRVGAVCDLLRTENPEIELPLEKVLNLEE